MRTFRMPQSKRLVKLALAGVALSAVFGLAACAVDAGPGYGYGGPSVGVGVDYYEPYGAVYGGWEPGYYVGPYRDGRGGGPGPRGPIATHSFRGSSGNAPSIPSGPRGGGGARGGGGGGGGHRP